MNIKEDSKKYFHEKCLEIKSGYTPHNQRIETYGSGLQTIAHLFDISAIKDGQSILEIGSGTGRLAMPLVDWNVSFTGVEVMKEAVDFCTKAFFPWKEKFGFYHVDIYNEYYNPSGNIFLSDYHFEFPDETFDSVIFCSVMTHIVSENNAGDYLKEAHRMLKKGGKVWVTWFRCPPNGELNEALRTCLKESFIFNLIADLGFRIEYTFGGFTSYWHDQWETHLIKK